jgi:hypothetical protein
VAMVGDGVNDAPRSPRRTSPSRSAPAPTSPSKPATSPSSPATCAPPPTPSASRAPRCARSSKTRLDVRLQARRTAAGRRRRAQPSHRRRADGVLQRVSRRQRIAPAALRLRARRNALGKLSGCGPRRARRPGRSGGHPHARGDRLVTTPPSLVHGTSDQPRAPGSQHRARRRSSRSSTGPVGRKSRDEAHRTAGRMTSQSSAEYFRLVNQPTRDGWAALGVLGARALMMLATPTQMSSRTSERLSTALMRRSRRETPGRRR